MAGPCWRQGDHQVSGHGYIRGSISVATWKDPEGITQRERGKQARRQWLPIGSADAYEHHKPPSSAAVSSQGPQGPSEALESAVEGFLLPACLHSVSEGHMS